MKAPVPNLLTFEQARALLNEQVSISTLRFWAAQNRFRTVRPGRRRFVDEASLLEYIQSTASPAA
jgi:hypothetical protein